MSMSSERQFAIEFFVEPSKVGLKNPNYDEDDKDEMNEEYILDKLTVHAKSLNIRRGDTISIMKKEER